MREYARAHGRLALRPASRDHCPTRADRPVYVIGGGPGGLAAAYALRAQGMRAVVLEKADAVGASWRRHYDRLHLHTTRRLSALPGLAMPRSFGRWVARDDVVRYLEKYAEHHELEIVTGVEVSRVERTPDGTGWLLHATGGRELTGSRGRRRHRLQPHPARCPDWPGRDAYTRRPAARRPTTATPRPTPAGTSSSSASATPAPRSPSTWSRAAPRGCGWPCAPPRTSCAVRRPAGPAQCTGILVRRLPVRLVDRLGRADGEGERARPVGARAAPPRHRALLPGQARAPSRSRTSASSTPSARGGSRSWPPWRASRTARSSLADGYRIAPDAVDRRHRIPPRPGGPGRPPRRTRRRRADPVVHGPRTPKDAPGLYFTGFTNPISGMFRELAIDAERIAKAVRRRRR